MQIVNMETVKVSDKVKITVKRIEVVAKILKIEGDLAVCSFYMPRSKGMSLVKLPITELQKA